MADFCKQCSLELFGEDSGDLAGIANEEFPVAHVLCEGCGQILVDKNGVCVSFHCLKQHNAPEDILGG